MTTRPSLQAEIVAILERVQPATVRDVAGLLDPPRAFTTVATVLGRMVDQGRLVRAFADNRWTYRVAPDHNRQIGEHIATLLDRAAGDSEPLLQALVGRVEEIDPALLDRLESIIAARRRGRG